jgi:sugar O-acyltransferase (sialic acid O-acetyltransferase NeuD family)
MKKAFIFGQNDFAELLLHHIKHTADEPEICGFTVNNNYMLQPSQEFCGLPVISFENIVKDYPPGEYGIYVCVGYKHMNEGRRKVYKNLEDMGFSILSYIHPSAHIDVPKIGKGTIALQNVIIDAMCDIGKGNIFYPGSLLSHHCSIGNFNFFAVKSCIAGHVKIGDGCFFGAHSTVKNGISLGDQTLVGANAYVDKDTEPRTVVVPSRSFILEGKSSLNIL